MPLSPPEFRRVLEQYIIWFKADLMISTQCAAIIKNLHAHLVEDDLFIAQLSDHFKPPVVLPYEVKSSDLEQVAILKRLFNMLHHCELAFRCLENIDLSPKQFSTQVFYDTYVAVNKAVGDLYQVLQLLNHGHGTMARFMGPYIQSLFVTLGHVSPMMPSVSSTDELVATLKKYDQKAAQCLAAGVKRLPLSVPTDTDVLRQVSTAIYLLPQHIDMFRQCIASEPVAAVDKDKLKKKINDLTSVFARLIAAEGVGMLPSYTLIIHELLAHSSAILLTVPPLTHASYAIVEQRLNHMRHVLLPQLISEVERVEDDFCLKRGKLVQPFSVQLEQYYRQIAEVVQQLPVIQEQAAATHQQGVVFAQLFPRPQKEEPAPKPRTQHLNVMRDVMFERQLKREQKRRLLTHERHQQTAAKQDAATTFFKQLESLSRLGPANKKELAAWYKVFQPDVAVLYPETDKLILAALSEPGSRAAAFLRTVTSYVPGYSDVAVLKKTKAQIMTLLANGTISSMLQPSLIQARLAEQEQRIHAARETAVSLLGTTSIFVEMPPLTPNEMAKQSLALYRQKRVDLGVKLHQIQEAEKELVGFLRSLDAPLTDRAALSLAYLTVQPFVLLFEKKPSLQLANQRCCQALSQDPVDSAVLRGILASVGQHLAILHTSYAATDRSYAEQELHFSQCELSARAQEPLVEFNREAALFGRLHALKLSQKIDAFISVQFMPFLKQHLEAYVYDRLAAEPGPYTSFYQDPPEVIFYKKLMNAILHVQQCLIKLEDAHQHGSRYQTLYVNALVLPLINAIYSASYYMEEASSNPGLKMVFDQLSEILHPLRAYPMFNAVVEYMTRQDAPDDQAHPASVDMVRLWEEQQRVATAVLTGRPVPSKKPLLVQPIQVDDGESTPAAATAEPSVRDTLKDAMRMLYLRSNQLRAISEREEPNDAILPEQEALIEALLAKLCDTPIDSASLYGAEHLKYALQAIIKVSKTLSDHSQALRGDLLFEQAKNIGTTLMFIAENIEFNLGLRHQGFRDVYAQFPEDLSSASMPELLAQPLSFSSLTTQVRYHFDLFYRGLLDAFPFPPGEEEIERRRLYAKGSLTHASLISNKLHYRRWRQDQTPEDMHAHLFVNAHPRLDVVRRDLNALKALGDERHQFLKLYDSLCPYLSSKDARYKKEVFLPRLKRNANFEAARRSILRSNSELRTVRETFQKLVLIPVKIIRTGKPWAITIELASHAEFCRLYEELEPYLKHIDPKYAKATFLPRLRSAADFEGAYQEIVALDKACSVQYRAFEALEEMGVGRAKVFNPIDRAAFFRLYRRLQPYLSAVDPKYDTASFLSGLETDDDVETAYQEIIDLEKQLSTPYPVFVAFKAFRAEKPEGAIFDLLDRDNFCKFYEKLYPYLKCIDSKYDETSFLSKLETDADFQTAYEEMISLEDRLLNPHGVFTAFKALYPVERIDQAQFLRLYSQLHPYLRCIDFKYDKKYFLRELRTDEDFDAAYHEIVGLEDKLHELIEARQTERDEKLQRYEKRIKDLEQRALLESTLSATSVQQLKRRLFTSSLRPLFASQLGPYTAGFLKKINRQLERSGRGLDFNEDPVEKLDLDAMTPSALRAHLISQRGVQNEVTRVLSGIHLEKCKPVIEKEAQALARRVKTMSEFKTYQALKLARDQLETLLRKQAQVEGDTPLTNEREAVTAEIRQALDIVTFTSTRDAAIHCKKLEKYSRFLTAYEGMLRVDAALTGLLRTVDKKPDCPIQQEKSRLLKDLKRQLVNEAQDPDVRLQAVADAGLTKESKAILKKQSEWGFINLLYRVRRRLGEVCNKVQVKYDQQYSLFKKETKAAEPGSIPTVRLHRPSTRGSV